MLTFPSVEAMMMVLPDDDGPNSWDRSTLMVRMFPSTFISTFFMQRLPFPLCPFPFAMAEVQPALPAARRGRHQDADLLRDQRLIGFAVNPTSLQSPLVEVQRKGRFRAITGAQNATNGPMRTVFFWIWWRGQDSNLRSRFRRQIYSLLVLAAHPEKPYAIRENRGPRR